MDVIQRPLLLLVVIVLALLAYLYLTQRVAARIADYARPGEVLVTQEVVDASRSARLGRCHPCMHVAHVARRRARGIRRIVDDRHFSWKG